MMIGRISLDWRLIGGLALVLGAVLVLDPSLARAALPFLLVAACPLAMVFMMRGMGGMAGGRDENRDRLDGRVEPDPRPVTSAPVDLGHLRHELDDLAARQAFIRTQLQALEADTTSPQSMEGPSGLPDGTERARLPS